jgi:hypothetical protein
MKVWRCASWSSMSSLAARARAMGREAWGGRGGGRRGKEGRRRGGADEGKEEGEGKGEEEEGKDGRGTGDSGALVQIKSHTRGAGAD